MTTIDVRFDADRTDADCMGAAAAALVISQEGDDDDVMTGVPADVHTVRIILPVDPARTAGMRVAERLTRLLAQCSGLTAAELVGREVATTVGQPTTTDASDLFCNTLLDALVSRQISALRLRCLAFADRHLPCLKYVLAGPQRSLKHSLREVDLERVLLPDARAYRSIAKRLAHVRNLHTLRVDAPWLDGVAHYGLPAGVRRLTLQLSSAVASESRSTAAARRLMKHCSVVVQMHHDFGAGSHPAEEVASVLFDCFPSLADMRHHAVELTVCSSGSGSGADEMFRRTLFEILFVWLGRAHPALCDNTTTTTMSSLSEWSTAVLGLVEPLDAADLCLDLTVQLTEAAAHDGARHIVQHKRTKSTKQFRAFMGCLERAGVFKARAVRCP